MNTLTTLAATALLLAATQASAAPPAPCPPTPMRVVRSAGGVIDYLGTVPGLPQLCELERADGHGLFYFGVWRSDWPGAGDAFPALYAVLNGAPGAKASFITRSVPGMQWRDSFVNEGTETLVIDGRPHEALRIAHERTGIEGNLYHSIITVWRDVATGISLKVQENQIAGQSYGPATTWQATAVQGLAGAAPAR